MLLALGACGEPQDEVASEAATTSGTPGTSGTSGEVSTGGASTGAASTETGATGDETGAPTTGGSSGDAAVCGDGVVEGDEACDDGNANANDACLPGCALAMCGDLSVQVGVEECDDGNQVDDDKCTNACKYAVCGDGIEGPGEGCDDGNNVDKDACSNDCVPSTCGDGDIQPGEDCDEGVETAACNINCTESKCGDGVPNAKAGEACDAAGESPTCDDDCTAAKCGDGAVNMTAGEVCDDGGESGDCNADCTVAACGDGKVNANAGEVCDAAGESAACNADCSAAKCGDGKLNATAGEVCDGGGESAACNGDCTPAVCGDGKINAKAGELCDDGNALFGDACSPLCLSTPIGLAPGYGNVCAVYADKSAHCWGSGANGGLGYGNVSSLGDGPGELPTAAVSVGGKVVQMSVGGHSCARLDTGNVRCWGYNAYGQLGQGHTNNLGDGPGELPVPDIAVGASVLQIEAGGSHTCALIDTGAVRCWGSHMYGELGYTSFGGKTKPDGKDVVGIAGAVQIALGNAHTCALLADGTVLCWGYNSDGELGLGNSNHVGSFWGAMPPPPSKIGDLNDVVQQIAAGARHTCALLASGKVRCWGYNNAGQVGASFGDMRVGDQPADLPPPDVDLGGPAVQVVAGMSHSCALMKTGKVKCWGAATANGYPGAGDINNAIEMPPLNVDLGGDVASLGSHTGAFTCALLGDKTVRCWGANADGQLGLGNTSPIGDNEAPASVMPVPL